jgi:hypothetical protein
MSDSRERRGIGIRQVDWRGWIALAWALCWAFGYCGMVLQARGQRIVDWFRPPAASLTMESSSTTVPSKVQAR